MAVAKLYMYGWLASFGDTYEKKPENQYISASAFTKVFNDAKAKATSIDLHLHIGDIGHGINGKFLISPKPDADN